MKKTSKKDKINLLFSAFLVIAFVICGYFFSTLAQTLSAPWNAIVGIAVFVLFGLVLFYATRVGEGKQICRLSLSSLIVVVLPSLYIMLASLISSMPLYEQISGNPTVVMLAGVAFGYGLPYSFLSGFELKTEEEKEAAEAPAEEAVAQEEESEENADYPEMADEIAAEIEMNTEEISAEANDEAPEESAAEETADKAEE